MTLKKNPWHPTTYSLDIQSAVHQPWGGEVGALSEAQNLRSHPYLLNQKVPFNEMLGVPSHMNV